MGYFSATPPIAGLIKAADLALKDVETDRSWTSNIFVLRPDCATSVHLHVAELQPPPHENKMADGHDDLASLTAWVNQKHLDLQLLHVFQKHLNFQGYDAQNDSTYDIQSAVHAHKKPPPHSKNFGT